MKQGAMFGIEGRALKKESERLFLASLIRYCSPYGRLRRLSLWARCRRLTFRLVAGQQASYHVSHQNIIRHNLITNKTGDMFGLDARIALAIFGALSVISGASLYSAIQEAQVVAILQEYKEA